MNPPSKTLVIDASIARAAGGENSKHPDSTHAREFLNTVLDVCHKIAMTPAIQEEWNKHQSNYARKWRSTMVARKKLVNRAVPENQALRESIENLATGENNKAAMLKDCHLLEAAMVFDERITSSDDKAGNLFREASAHITGIRHLLWINPISDAEAAQTWLKEGAPDKPEWQLRR